MYSLWVILLVPAFLSAEGSAPQDEDFKNLARRLNEMKLSLKEDDEEHLVLPEHLKNLKQEDFDKIVKAADYIKQNRDRCYSDGAWSDDDGCNQERSKIEEVLVKQSSAARPRSASWGKSAASSLPKQNDPVAKLNGFASKTFDAGGGKNFGSPVQIPDSSMKAKTQAGPDKSENEGGGGGGLKPVKKQAQAPQAPPKKQPERKKEQAVKGEFATPIAAPDKRASRSPVVLTGFDVKGQANKPFCSVQLHVGQVASEKGAEPGLGAAIYAKECASRRAQWLGIAPLYKDFTNKEMVFARTGVGHSEEQVKASGNLSKTAAYQTQVRLITKEAAGETKEKDKKPEPTPDPKRKESAQKAKEGLNEIIGGIDVDKADAATLNRLAQKAPKSRLRQHLESKACVDMETGCEGSKTKVMASLEVLWKLPMSSSLSKLRDGSHPQAAQFAEAIKQYKEGTSELNALYDKEITGGSGATPVAGGSGENKTYVEIKIFGPQSQNARERQILLLDNVKDNSKGGSRDIANAKNSAALKNRMQQLYRTVNNMATAASVDKYTPEFKAVVNDLKNFVNQMDEEVKEADNDEKKAALLEKWRSNPLYAKATKAQKTLREYWKYRANFAREAIDNQAMTVTIDMKDIDAKFNGAIGGFTMPLEGDNGREYVVAQELPVFQYEDGGKDLGTNWTKEKLDQNSKKIDDGKPIHMVPVKSTPFFNADYAFAPRHLSFFRATADGSVSLETVGGVYFDSDSGNVVTENQAARPGASGVDVKLKGLPKIQIDSSADLPKAQIKWKVKQIEQPKTAPAKPGEEKPKETAADANKAQTPRAPAASAGAGASRGSPARRGSQGSPSQGAGRGTGANNPEAAARAGSDALKGTTEDDGDKNKDSGSNKSDDEPPCDPCSHSCPDGSTCPEGSIFAP